MKNIFKIISIFTITLFSISCEKDLPTDSTLESYVGFEMNKQLDLKRNQTSIVPIKVVASETSNVDRTFPLRVNLATTETNLAASFYTVPPTVTIPAGSKEGFFNVTIIVNNNNLSAGRTIKIEFPQTSGLNQASSYSTTVANGVTTYNPSQRGIKLFLYEECLNTRIKMSIKFDNYPEETAWALRNSSNVLIDSGGFAANGTTITGYAALGFADQSTFSAFKCLAPGSYTFTIYDDYGDGMFTSATVQGNYKLELLNGTVLATGTGNFGTSASHTFTIN
jgi:hypothetical protein